MHDRNSDWDRKLSRPPFQGKRFTRTMMVNVENRLKSEGPSDKRGRNLRTLLVVAAFSVFFAIGGVLAVMEMQENEHGQFANPGQTTLESGQPSDVPSETPPAFLPLVLEPGDGGEAVWWNDLELEYYDKTGDTIIIPFVQALMQRKLGIMGGPSPETDRLWENPEDKQVLEGYELSSPWISEIHVGVISENDEHWTYELRLLLTDSTQSEIRETIRVLIGKYTDKISQVETQY